MKIRLLATDLDGTLIGSSGELPLYEEFRGCLKEMRAKYGAKWVVCTGRSLRSFNHLFSPMRTMGFMPDYVIVDHAFIYRRTKSGKYRPHYSWNFMIRYHIWSSRLYIKDAIKSWHAMVLDTVEGVTTVYHNKSRLCLRFDHDEDAEAVVRIIKEKARGFKYLRVFHYSQEIDIRMVPFTKGLALEELSDRLGINRAEILAIGNGHNDISMLDGAVAKLTGCPANAETDVMAVVNRSGGHISRIKSLGGVIDVIHAYLEDRVNSQLPEWWVANKQQKNPKSAGRYMNHPPKYKKYNRKKMTAIVIIAMIIYSLLLVFANYGIIPFSSYILMPLQWLMDGILKIVNFF